MNAALILNILLSFQTNVHDTESLSERILRLRYVAQAIEEVSTQNNITNVELQKMLITIGYFESGFAQHIHEGKCYKNECDHGRAKSIYQMHVNDIPFNIWKNIDNIQSTKIATEYAAKNLLIAFNKCKTIKGAFSYYATGKICNWKGSDSRYTFYLGLSEQ